MDDSGARHKVGIFIAEKPTRGSQNSYKVTAYDHVTKLDKDLTDWIMGLSGWPYKMRDFAEMVCEQCGLQLASISFPNGEYEIQQFLGNGITGRQLMSWVGQAAARYISANEDGDIVLDWYRQTDRSITPSGDLFYYRGGLSYEDYDTYPIEKVQIQLTDDDIGVIYPNVEGDANTYRITGNYLLTTDSPAPLQEVAKNIYDQISTVTYTPCSVSIVANLNVRAGDIISVTDANGKTITAYIMTKTNSGMRDTLECTGSYRLDSTTAVHDESFRAVNSKMLEIKKSIEGIDIRATNLDTKITEGQIQTDQKIADLQVTAESITSEVSQVKSETDTVKQQIVSIQQNYEAVNIQVQNIVQNGVDKVVTSTGYVFGADGLNIHKAGDEIETRIDNTGLYVSRGEDMMLQANHLGVVARDLTANHYLIFGAHARFEDYSGNRTACFYIGKESEG